MLKLAVIYVRIKDSWCCQLFRILLRFLTQYQCVNLRFLHVNVKNMERI